MSERLKIILALFVSALTPPLCFAAWVTVLFLLEYLRSGILGTPGGLPYYLFFAFLIALAHAVLLGLPYFYILRIRNRVQWWTSTVGGLCIGCIPVSLLTLALYQNLGTGLKHGQSAAHDYGMVEMVTEGHLTPAAWLSVLNIGAAFGTLGAIAGLAAWAVWRFVPSKAK